MTVTLHIEDAHAEQICRQLQEMPGVKIVEVEPAYLNLPDEANSVDSRDYTFERKISEAVAEYVAVREGRATARPLVDVLREL